MVDLLKGIGQTTGVLGLALVALTILGALVLTRSNGRGSNVERVILHVKGLITLEVHRKVDCIHFLDDPNEDHPAKSPALEK